MKAYLLCLLFVGLGTTGALLENESEGRLVASEGERVAVVGATCYGQGTELKSICKGGVDSDCTGCGCVNEYEANDEDQGYAAPSVECDDDANCKYNFRRGSCKPPE